MSEGGEPAATLLTIGGVGPVFALGSGRPRRLVGASQWRGTAAASESGVATTDDAPGTFSSRCWFFGKTQQFFRGFPKREGPSVIVVRTRVVPIARALVNVPRDELGLSLNRRVTARLLPSL